MKKMIIAAVAIAFATFANAATANWNSGALNLAANAQGGWGTSSVTTASALVTVSVFYIDAETYASMSTLSQADLYGWAAEKTADITGQNLNTSSSIIAAANVKDTSVDASKTYYAILTAEYTDAKFGDMYMAVAKTVNVSAQGTGTTSNIFGGTTGVKDWQPVPEPTSGLLLLLGMAGLALRRKQA